MMVRRPQPGFSVLEVLVSLVVIAILVGLLVPCLIYARDSARSTLCAGNLKQVGNAWQMYLTDFDRFPAYDSAPEWKYGGVIFAGPGSAAMLASDRPINKYIAEEGSPSEGLTQLFRCPGDVGVFELARGRQRRGLSVLPNAANCFETFGTSYRANPLLLNARLAGIDPVNPRPLRLTEIAVNHSRLLLMGDPEWHYATRDPGDPDAVLDATWHTVPAAGNYLALDGSVKFHRFDNTDGESSAGVTFLPRPR